MRRRRRRHERVVDLLERRPRGVLEPHLAGERHAPPRPAVQLHEPGAALTVPQKLDHEKPGPPRVGQHPPRGGLEVGVHGERDARAGRSLRAYRTHPAVGARNQHLAVAGKSEQASTSPNQERLDYHRLTGAVGAHGGLQLPVARAHAHRTELDPVVALLHGERRLDRDGELVDLTEQVDGRRERAGRQHLEAGLVRGLHLDPLVQREPRLVADRPHDPRGSRCSPRGRTATPRRRRAEG